MLLYEVYGIGEDPPIEPEAATAFGRQLLDLLPDVKDQDLLLDIAGSIAARRNTGEARDTLEA